MNQYIISENVQVKIIVFLCQPSPIAILTANGSCTPNHVDDFRLKNVDVSDGKAVPLIYDGCFVCASHMLNHIRKLQYAALVFISLLTSLFLKDLSCGILKIRFPEFSK